MANKIALKIITPSGLFFDDNVEIVTLKTTEGYIGFQANNSPFIGAIEIGELIIEKFVSKKRQICAIGNGLVYVTSEQINVIAESIETKENIDLKRAREAKKIAEEKLKQNLSKIELMQTTVQLKKALNRIKVKGEN